MNLAHITQQVSDLARRVGQQIWTLRQNTEVQIETKGRHDFVTQMDKLSEKLLVEELTQILPEAGFIAEEQTKTELGAEFNWVVDPIDGTTNFIHGQPPSAISIALLQCTDIEHHRTEGQILVGVVYEMSRDELFAAWLGGGATLNGKPIKVSQNNLDNALVATGFPYSNFERLDDYMLTLRDVMESTAGVRRLGSAATDMAYVAVGRYDAFFEYDLKPYDVAAGALLVTEAGGCLSDFCGGRDYIFGREMVATNQMASADFRAMVQRRLGTKKEEI